MSDVLTFPGADQLTGLPNDGLVLASDRVVIQRGSTFHKTTVGELVSNLVDTLLQSDRVTVLETLDEVTVVRPGITVDSKIIAQIMSDDTTAKTAIVIPGDGEFVVKLNAAATADVEVTVVVFA
jgi:hypothetical protein